MAGIRFYRCIPILPGLLYLNIGKTGISISIGRSGLSFNISRRGVQATAGIPGTGLSATKKYNTKQKTKRLSKK